MALPKKEKRRLKIRKGIRSIISGSSTRPRLSVFRSNKHIYAQLIDDVASRTLACASSTEAEIDTQKITKTEKARLAGKLIANKAKAKGIVSVVFDRGGYLYHGRVKALAEAARENGLKF